ncbi:MAG: ABC transporter ATP-binding protein [Bacteroidales bacterium]|nr:ABC transporter ATP-binding protein [Bacteroidales bacterium]
MQVLKTHSLSIGYANKIIASGIDISLDSGDLVALIGPNGAGKSTLFKTLSGHIKPVSGTIEINGENAENLTAKERAKMMSVVLTERPDDMFLTVHEIVSSGRFPYLGMFGKLSGNDEKIVEESLELIGIKHLSDRLFNTLSDGERQKVMIAKSIAQNTPIIFLDEPTAFLDYPSKIELFSILKRLASEQKKTIIFSSHDLELLLRYTDSLWVMGRHLPFIKGSCSELLKNGKIQEYFNLQDTDNEYLTNRI